MNHHHRKYHAGKYGLTVGDNPQPTKPMPGDEAVNKISQEIERMKKEKKNGKIK